MGFFERIAGAALGMGPVEQCAQRLLADVEEAAARQQKTLTLTVTQRDIGVRNDLESAVALLVSRIEAAGHDVLALHTDDPFASSRQIRVQPSRSQAPNPGTTPARGSLQVAAPPLNPRQPGESAEGYVWRSLRPWWQPDTLGTPFGPGAGLEQACATAAAALAGEPDRVTFLSESYTEAVTRDVGMGEARMGDWDDILGHQRRPYARAGLSTADLQAAVDRLGHFKDLCTQINPRAGASYSRWQHDQAFQLEALVWAYVIRCRLGESGKTWKVDLTGY